MNTHRVYAPMHQCELNIKDRI